MEELFNSQEEERIREIIREEIEKYMGKRAGYLSLSIIHDYLKPKQDDKTNTQNLSS